MNATATTHRTALLPLLVPLFGLVATGCFLDGGASSGGESSWSTPAGSDEDASSTAECDSDRDCDLAAGEVCDGGECSPNPDFSGGVDAESENDAREVDGYGGDESTTIGAPIGELCGVVAYQNGPNPGQSAGYGDFGFEYQCTEFAYRFVCTAYGLCDAYDWDSQGRYKDAKHWYGNTTNTVLAGLTRYDNGGTVPPAPGDVIAKGGDEWGHVAVVSDVDLAAGIVTLVEQNCYGCTHAARITESGGRYTVAGGWQGWMREEGGWARSCAAEASCEGELLSTDVTGRELRVTADIGCDDAIEQVSLVVGSRTVYTQTIDRRSYRLDVEVDLVAAGADDGRQPLGLWVRLAGRSEGILLDSTHITWDRSEDCDNGYDDDGDGRTDCDDADCEGAADCATCGDGVVNRPDEECDGADLDGETCASLGYDGGTLRCQSSSCTFNTSSCTTHVDTAVDATDTSAWCASSSGRDIFEVTRVSLSSATTDPRVTATIEKCDGSTMRSTKSCHIRVGSWSGASYSSSLDRVSFTWSAGASSETVSWDAWSSASSFAAANVGDTKEFYVVCAESGGDWNHWRAENPVVVEVQ